MESSDVPFKVYYLDEIRRFSLRSSQSLSYTDLVLRIQSVFDIPPTAQLRLRWLDAEGDRIAFSSSSELTDAVLHLTSRQDREPGAAVRVYVSAKAEDGSDLGGFDQATILHPGVYCDGCNTSLRGYRFKCLVCPDYDLCLGCLNRDTHSQHQMTLIRRPGDQPHYHGFGAGWAANHHAAMRRCFSQRQQHGCCESTQASGSTGEHCRRSCRKMRDAQASATGATVTSGAATAAAPEVVTSTARVGTEELQLIEHVTSAINTFLEPLGIDASIQVMRQEADAEVQAQPQRHDSADAAIKASLLTEATKVQLAQSQVSFASGVPPPPPPPRAESSAAFHQRLDSSSASFGSAATDSDGASTAIPCGDFELVDRTTTPTGGEAADLKIVRALEHMTAMGFNDDGGWLTRLLRAKDGDICAVLDAIRPIGGAK